jgi:hypothetical protein
VCEVESPWDPSDIKEEVTLVNSYVGLSKAQIREVQLMRFQFADVLKDSLKPGQAMNTDPAHIYMKDNQRPRRAMMARTVLLAWRMKVDKMVFKILKNRVLIL